MHVTLRKLVTEIYEKSSMRSGVLNYNMVVSILLTHSYSAPVDEAIQRFSSDISKNSWVPRIPCYHTGLFVLQLKQSCAGIWYPLDY